MVRSAFRSSAFFAPASTAGRVGSEKSVAASIFPAGEGRDTRTGQFAWRTTCSADPPRRYLPLGSPFPDDHGVCSDSIDRPENSRVNRSLFDLDLYFGRLPIRHRSNALQKSVANRSLQIGELQRVFMIQLRE